MPINRIPSSVASAKRRGPLLVAVLATLLVTSADIVSASAQQVTAPKPTERLLPSARLKAPYPPAEEGCRYLKDGKWVEVPCATEEELQRRRLPPPAMLNAVVSNPHPLVFFVNRPGITVTTPIIWGAVSIAFQSNPTQSTESDGNSNAFSLQTNTNYFPCSTCKSGYPFGSVPGIPDSASQAGDPGWVQFAFQNFSGGASQLCIWQIDVGITVNTNNAMFTGDNGGYANSHQAGYHKDCVAEADLPITAPLTGPGAVVPQQGQSPAVGDAEVIGYITCPSTGCLLQLVAYLPWANENWYSITKKDVLGLSGNWTNVNGSILGSGGNSTAVFSANTNILQTIAAYSCVDFSAATGYMAEPCAAPKTPILRLFELSASPTFSPYTGEQNNLVSGPPKFTCRPYDCVLSFDSTP
jgi:hypothetical protein